MTIESKEIERDKLFREILNKQKIVHKLNDLRDENYKNQSDVEHKINDKINFKRNIKNDLIAIGVGSLVTLLFSSISSSLLTQVLSIGVLGGATLVPTFKLFGDIKSNKKSGSIRNLMREKKKLVEDESYLSINRDTVLDEVNALKRKELACRLELDDLYKERAKTISREPVFLDPLIQYDKLENNTGKVYIKEKRSSSNE